MTAGTAPDVDALCRVLDDETRTGETLRETLRLEQSAIIGLRPEEVLACVAQRRALHDDLERLAARRRALVAEALGDGGGPTVQALLPRLPAEARARLRDAVRRLRRTLLEARSLERQNRILAGASLEVTGELLAALRSRLPGTRYGADARLATTTPAEALDRRA